MNAVVRKWAFCLTILTFSGDGVIMFFKGPNNTMYSTLSGPELLALCDKVDKCAEKIDEIREDINLFKEMFGEDT